MSSDWTREEALERALNAILDCYQREVYAPREGRGFDGGSSDMDRAVKDAQAVLDRDPSEFASAEAEEA